MHTVSASVSDHLSARLDRLAANQNRSPRQLVALAVERFVNGADYHSLLQEGVHAADRGDTLTQDEAEAWFEEHLEALRAPG